MADNVKNWTPWDLDKLYWAPEAADPQLAIVQGNEWILAVTDWVSKVSREILNNDWIVNKVEITDEDKEELRGLLIKKLETLEWKLSEAIGKLEPMFSTWFWEIEWAIVNLEYMDMDLCYSDGKRVTLTDIDNIEISTVFASHADIANNIALYEKLLEKLTTKDPNSQAHLLWFIILLNGYLERKKVVVDGWKILCGTKIFEEDIPKQLFFENPALNLNYAQLISKIFEIHRTHNALFVEVSPLFHRVPSKKLSPEEKKKDETFSDEEIGKVKEFISLLVI